MLNPIHLTVRGVGLGLCATVFSVKAFAFPIKLGVHVGGAVLHRDDPPPEPPHPAAVVVEEAPPEPSPKERRRAARREPTRGQAQRQRRARAEEEQEAAQPTDGLPHAGPEIEVAEPWEGYAEMQVVDVLNRLSGADDTTRAAVRLYELAHEHREAILHVTEG